MKLVGIDSSSKKTGMSLFIDGRLSDYGLIDHHKEKNSDSRMENMSKDILKTLNIWNPDIVYIENTWYKNNIKTVQMLTTILGVVWGWALINDKKYVKIGATTWRKVVGLGNDEREKIKDKSILAICEKYGINVNDDVADAIFVGLAGEKLEEEND